MPNQNKAATENVSKISKIGQDATHRAGEISEHMAHIGTNIAETAVEITQQATRSTLEMATQLAERSVDQFGRAFSLADRDGAETVQQSARNIEAVAQATAVLVHGFQDISREWLDWTQQRFQRHLDGFNALLKCRTPQDFIAAQSDLMRGNLELLLSSSRRIAERSVEVAEEAVQTLTVPAEQAAKQTSRAADQPRRAA